MDKTLALVISVLAILGLPSSDSGYIWRNYTTQGDILYAVKFTNIYGPTKLQIPERSDPDIWSTFYKVVAIDLTGTHKIRPVKSYRLIPDHPVDPTGYRHMEIAADGSVALWGQEALWKRLTKIGGISCLKGSWSDVKYDAQDSRILYVYCDERKIAYRFDPPYSQVCVIKFRPEIDLKDLPPMFYSTLGEPEIFMQAGWNLYQTDGCANTKTSKVDGLADRSGRLPPTSTESRLTTKALIAISIDLRIYQTATQNGFEVVIEQTGQATKRIALPSEIPARPYPIGTYLAKDQLVLWEVQDSRTQQNHVYTLKLSTETFRKTSVPY